VELALELSDGSGLQNLSAVALPIATQSQGARAVKVLFQKDPLMDTVALRKTCARAEEDGALSALYFLLQCNIDHGYQLQDYWNVFDGVASAKHSEFLSYLVTQTSLCQDDSVLEKRFVEAAQGGYLSAMELWNRRVCTLANYKLLLAQALDQACANGHVSVVSYLVELGVDVNMMVEEPVDPFTLSDYEGSVQEYHEMFLHREGWKMRWDRRTIYQKRWGLEYHECIDGVNKKQAWPRTALHACLQAIPQYGRIRGISNGHFRKFRERKNEFLLRQQAVIELLLRQGADVNAVDRYGRSALHYAALNCPVATVEAILANGATVNPLDKDNKTPLVYAVWREIDSLPVLQALTKAEARVITLSTPPIPPTLLLDTALSVFREGFIESESVHEVLTTGSGAVISNLLISRPELQAIADGFTMLLHMASVDSDENLVQLLIERNVDVKAVAYQYGTALHGAAQFGHLNCVKLLVEAGADIDSPAGRYEWTPLRAAVQGQHLAIVQYLLEVGVNMRSFDCSTDELPAGVNDKCSSLTFACRSGKLELVQLLLSYSEQSSPILDHSNKKHIKLADMPSAIYAACSHGHAQIVALLIDYGADIEEKFDHFQSPLTAAAVAGSLEMMKILLTAGAVLYDAKRAINVLETLVVRERPKDIVDFVLGQLLDTDNLIPACKVCPAYMRAWQEDAEFVLRIDIMQSSESLLVNLAALGAQRSFELLIEKSIDIVGVSTQMLQAAAYFQRYEFLFALLPMMDISQHVSLEYQSSIYALLEGLMPLRMKTHDYDRQSCCEVWNSDAYYSWIDEKSRKKCTCETTRAAAGEVIMELVQIMDNHVCLPIGILHLASYLGMLQVVQICLELGVDINQQDHSFGSALIAAIKGGSLEITKFLLQRGIDIDYTAGEDGTPLYLACKTRNLELMRVLLQNGARLDDITPETATPLHMACENSDIGMVEILLQHGANPNTFSFARGTPLHAACESRNEKMVSMLLEYGADTDILWLDRGAALHITSRYHSSSLTRLLLEHGANVDIFSVNHGTPLHAACQGDHGDAVIQLLVKHGANVNSKGSKGETPLTSKLWSGEGFFPLDGIRSLIKTERQLDITEDDFKRLVALDLSSDSLGLLLARASYLKITPDILKTVKSVERLKLFTQHGSGIGITAELMEAFADPKNLALIKYCVESAPDVRPPAPVMTAISTALAEPEPKVMRSGFADPWKEHYRNIRIALANEIMELIVARHPDVGEVPTTTMPQVSQETDLRA
jgi:ankyrin repeat protein